MRVLMPMALIAMFLLGACRPEADRPAEAVAVAGARASVALRLREVAGGFARPLAVVADGDGERLFVVEQDGRIRVVVGGRTQAAPFLDMARVGACRDAGGRDRALGFTPSAGGNERGLLGLALHPAFADNGRLFVDFTDGAGDTVVAEFAATASREQADPASCRIILRVDQDFSNHNGGDLHFGPDGHLYVALGDGGSGNDPCDRAGTLAPSRLRDEGECAPDRDFLASGGNASSRALLGKLLRLDVDRSTPAGSRGLCASEADGAAAYAVPADNAWQAGRREVCAETWTLGWRNPWRFSFDAGNGDLYVGDVGQNQVEEVTRIPAGTPAGGHYGWRRCEGDRDNRDDGCEGTLPPWLSYRHERGRCSVTGGVVYRGPDTALRGKYLFADYCTGEIFVADTNQRGFAPAGTAPPTSLALGITSFGQDASGRVYVVFQGLREPEGGKVYELGAAAP